jgi:hypothetical protein
MSEHHLAEDWRHNLHPEPIYRSRTGINETVIIKLWRMGKKETHEEPLRLQQAKENSASYDPAEKVVA